MRTIDTFTTLAIVGLTAIAPPCGAQFDPDSSEFWHKNVSGVPDSYEAGDRFGAAVAVCDFDGDGIEDLAIGVPGDNFALGILDNVGGVHVLYGDHGGVTTSNSEWFGQPPAGADPPEDGDFFGTSLAAGDFDGDGYCDLAVGVPNEDINSNSNAGAVQVFSGAAAGLDGSTSLLVHQNFGDWVTGPEANDFFGNALAAGNFNGDEYDDLAIATSRENWNFGGGVETIDSGVVHVVFGSSAGLEEGPGMATVQILRQGQGGIQDVEEDFDIYGQALAVGNLNGDEFDDLAIGIPFEDVDGTQNVGALNVVYGSAGGFTGFDSFISEHTPGFGALPEAFDGLGAALATGDFNGDGLDDVAVGIPGESVGSVTDAGAVAIFRGTIFGVLVVGFQIFQQDTPGVEGLAQEFDFFGSALASADFDLDGFADLVIGTPGEDQNAFADEGAITVLSGSATGLAAGVGNLWRQDDAGINGNGMDDMFGSVLATGDLDGDGGPELVIGVPDEDLDDVCCNDVPDAGAVGIMNTSLLFADGFESGNVSRWSEAVGD